MTLAAQAPLVAPDDYFTIIGTAEQDYSPSSDGVVEYCLLDSLDRAVCAYGNLTSTLREHEKASERESISADPSGWPANNGEVLIPARSDIDGSQPYSGWLWNRSHLVADSLGGDPTLENLVSGTRTQNVGSTRTNGQYSGGMAYTELIARDYLDTNNADSCPLYYAATPEYLGDELVPRSVTVDVLSCDGQINIRVEVYNTATGWNIDYYTAETTASQ